MIKKYSQLQVTENPNFQKWFRGSKLVDSSGNPLVFYHGTNKSEFSEFTVWRPNFFTTDINYAKVYGNKIYSVYLSIKAPFDTLNEKDRLVYNEEFIPYWINNYPTLTKEGNLKPLKEKELLPFTWANEFFSFLRKRTRNKGKEYDGIFVDEGSTAKIAQSFTKIAVVPLYSTQIKSATNNNGLFNPENANIYS